MRNCLILFVLFLLGCNVVPAERMESVSDKGDVATVVLDLAEANRLAALPLACIQNQWPYKSGIVLSSEADNALPIEHHPAFYGCFDWHSAVHGHWSLVYLLKTFPDLAYRDSIVQMLDQNLSRDNILKEVEYFSLNRDTKSFERTYGWAWLLKLAEEIHSWDDDRARQWYDNLRPLTAYISTAYQAYLPKLLYPIRVGEHSNTAFGLGFAYDYALEVRDDDLRESIVEAAHRFYASDMDCPISWEPSGYDFLSPCLQEIDVMRKVLDGDRFDRWSRGFLPTLYDASIALEPARVVDRSDGKLVHLDGLNFSRAWCLYSLEGCTSCRTLADKHLQYSLDKMVDGDYAGQHWLASFALYAFKSQH